jgi:phosphoenolpyruvate carboxylase
LKAVLKGSPFLRYVLTNIESSLVSANRGIMESYATLVADEGVRGAFVGRILGEYERTRAVLEDLFDGPFMVRRPRLAETLGVREAPLRVLHRQQIALLREWRGLVAAGDGAAAEAFLPDLLISVNAIASGLRTTG